MLRAATLGDPNLYVDEAFYFTAGQMMHDGAIPYIDFWDRKPFGLFAIYWAFAGLSNSVLSYQIPALAAAALTAWLIGRFAGARTTATGRVLAGIAYLALLDPMLGFGGQSPVFYNPLVAIAALLVLRDRERLEAGQLGAAPVLAVLLAGCAITIKQTAIAEGAYLGLWCLWCLRKGALPSSALAARALLLAFAGALPFLLIAAWYWQAGFWQPFWHAMVTANLDRPRLPLEVLYHNLMLLPVMLGPLAGTAVLSLMRRNDLGRIRTFVAGWIVAATVGFLLVPNLFEHYALPLLVPLCLAASAQFSRPRIGLVLAGAIIALALVLGRQFDFARHRQSETEVAAMAGAIRAHPGNGRLLIYDGPPILYTLTGLQPMTTLVFPGHLNNLYERNTSLLDTRRELLRIISARPDVVVMVEPAEMPPSMDALQALVTYARSQCRVVHRGLRIEPRGAPRRQVIYADCNRVKSEPSQ